MSHTSIETTRKRSTSRKLCTRSNRRKTRSDKSVSFPFESDTERRRGGECSEAVIGETVLMLGGVLRCRHYRFRYINQVSLGMQRGIILILHQAGWSLYAMSTCRIAWRLCITGPFQDVHEIRKPLFRADFAMSQLPSRAILHIPAPTSAHSTDCARQ